MEAEAEVALTKVKNLEQLLDQVHNLTLIEYYSMKHVHDREVSRWVWSLFGWNGDILRHLSQVRKLLVHVAELQQRASAHIVNAQTILLVVSANLRELNSEAMTVSSVGGTVSEQHLLSLSIGLDNLRSHRSKAEKAAAEKLRDAGLHLPGQCD